MCAFMLGCISPNALEIKYVLVGFAVLFISFMLTFQPYYLLLGTVLASGVWTAITFETTRTKEIERYLGKEVHVIGEIVAYPIKKNTELLLKVKPIQIAIVDEEYKSKEMHSNIQVKVKDNEGLKKGNIVEFISVIEEPRDFSDFNYTDHLKSQNIYSVTEAKTVKVFDQHVNMLVSLRSEIINKINDTFPGTHAKLLTGMLIGTREKFSESFAKSLSMTSTSHIIAVSGYNVSLITSSILSIAGLINRKLLTYLACVFILIFIIIVGVDNTPAFRAFIMGSILLTSKLLGRRIPIIKILVLVAMLFHVLNPHIYQSLSFQLSFVATAGLVLGSEPCTKMFKRVVPQGILDEFTSSITALLATFPISYASFGTIPVYGLFVNILVAPIVPLVTILGFAWILITGFNQSLGELLGLLVWGIVELLIKIIDFATSLPYANITLELGREYSPFLYILFLYFLFEVSYRAYKGHV